VSGVLTDQPGLEKRCGRQYPGQALYLQDLALVLAQEQALEGVIEEATSFHPEYLGKASPLR